MEFTMRLDMDNDAFQHGTKELRRLLKVVISDVEMARTAGMLFDVNGNRVGEWAVSK